MGGSDVLILVLRVDGYVINIGEDVCVWMCWDGYVVHEKVGEGRCEYRTLRNSIGERLFADGVPLWTI